MKTAFLLTGVAVAALSLTALPVFAQADITGQTTLNDRIDTITENVDTALARGTDEFRFGNPEFQPGLSGSAALGLSAASGNTKSQEFTLGLRLRSASGPFVQVMSAAIDYAKENNVKTKEDVFGVYDGDYYFNNNLYGFILGRVSTDGLADGFDENGVPDGANENKVDAFLGVGPGYRIFNTPQLTWRVQAGVGQSFLKDGNSDTTSEIGYIVSSRFFYAFSDNVFASNDTDVLYSKSATRINNDLGVNFKMNDTLSTRVSYLTEYNDSRAIRSDNTLGVAVVFGF